MWPARVGPAAGTSLPNSVTFGVEKPPQGVGLSPPNSVAFGVLVPVTSPSNESPTFALLDALRSSNHPLTKEELLARVPFSGRTLQRHLDSLIASGDIERPKRGLYRLAGNTPRLPGQADQIVGSLLDFGPDAHLTGFDVLAPYAHQFVYDYPHLVYAHPEHADSVEWNLNRAGFIVVPAGPRAHYSVPELSRVVVLRGQPNAESRYGIVDHVAAPEKAWVDLVRETRRSHMPFEFAELGRILRNMELSGRDLRRLRSYAKRAGYDDWWRATQGEFEPDDPDIAALAAGYAYA